MRGLLLGHRVTDISVEADGVTVRHAAGRTVRARLCVLATGGRYGLHRRVGLGLPGMYLHTAQRELPAGRPGEVELHFGRDVAPGGFAWAVPVWRSSGSYVRVGVMAERDAPLYFARMLERISARWDAPARIDGPPRQKILPLARPGPDLSGPADCRRRRGGPGQADHRRWHLLRAAERRHRRGGGRARPW